MRLTVVSFGSDGDTRPYAALCRGLLDAGHEVRLFAERSSVGIANALDVPVTTLAGDIRSILPTGKIDEELRFRDVMATGRRMTRLVTENTEAWLKAIGDHARDADVVLFSGLAMYAGVGAALELNKPSIGLWVLPITPTREFSSPMGPPMRLPGWANRLTYRALHATMWRGYGGGVNAARAKLFGGTTRKKIRLECPILYGMSSHLVARPSDWPATHQVCGHWFKSVSDWRPPDRLQEFMDTGPPPIYVGFGSPSSFVRQKRLDKVIAAIAGRRAIFYPGWSDIDASMLPRNFHVVRETPHDWLFPRCAAIIHHGGAGTTHTSARAGVPSIVMPFGADQFFWASRLSAAGVAPKYVNPRALDAQTLSKMIEFALQDDVRERARKLAAAMQQEDGIGSAVERIQSLSKALSKASS